LLENGIGVFCLQCGNRLSEETKFCSQCGKQVAPSAVAEKRESADKQQEFNALDQGRTSSFKKAMDETKKQSRKKMPAIVLFTLVLLLVSGIAFAVYYVYVEVVSQNQENLEESVPTNQESAGAADLEPTVVSFSYARKDFTIIESENTAEKSRSLFYPIFTSSSQNEAVDLLNAEINSIIEDWTSRTDARKVSEHEDPWLYDSAFMHGYIGVMYMKDNIVSLRVESYETYGGTNGWEVTQGITINLATGERLSPESVLGITSQERDLLTKDALETYVAENPNDLYYDDILTNSIPALIRGENGGLSYWLGWEGLVVTIPHYGLGAYAYSNKTVFVAPFDEGSLMTAGEYYPGLDGVDEGILEAKASIVLEK
jgi:hypothetical protein